jgi:hypothetical protein
MALQSYDPDQREIGEVRLWMAHPHMVIQLDVSFLAPLRRDYDHRLQEADQNRRSRLGANSFRQPPTNIHSRKGKEFLASCSLDYELKIAGALGFDIRRLTK